MPSDQPVTWRIVLDAQLELERRGAAANECDDRGDFPAAVERAGVARRRPETRQICLERRKVLDLPISTCTWSFSFAASAPTRARSLHCGALRERSI
jgi:hypothetical protein